METIPFSIYFSDALNLIMGYHDMSPNTILSLFSTNNFKRFIWAKLNFIQIIAF